jgi:hypothetical protein
MKYIISHRGNINGSNPNMENNPIYINKALEKGYYVKIDIHIKDNKFYLGNNIPQYEVSLDYLCHPKFWCHCKDLETLTYFLRYKQIHCFWHQNDDYTLTSNAIIWGYPGIKSSKDTIIVLPEKYYKSRKDLPECYGICTDYCIQFS